MRLRSFAARSIAPDVAPTNSEWRNSCARAGPGRPEPRPAIELYDLRHDPGEFRNLAATPAYAPVLAELSAKLTQWRKDTSDVAPARRTPDEFDRETGAPLPNRKRPRASKAEMTRD